MIASRRIWNPAEFRSAYFTFICGGHFQENPDYYPRYINRYRDVLSLYVELNEFAGPLQVLEVGGGQLALLAHKLWGDVASVADIGGRHLEFLQLQGVTTREWNLCELDQPTPFSQTFDVIFFSEVIEHLPVPGHQVLERLRLLLKPGGLIVCTTPNFYRARNVIYVMLGLPIFDYFRMPEKTGLGHVIEYSADHLAWQFSKAGFKNIQVRYHLIRHSPTSPIWRVFFWLSYPLLLLVPRFRDCLIATARA